MFSAVFPLRVSLSLEQPSNSWPAAPDRLIVVPRWEDASQRLTAVTLMQTRFLGSARPTDYPATSVCFPFCIKLKHEVLKIACAVLPR